MSRKGKKKILYLGHDPSRYEHKGKVQHFPIIQTVPFSLDIPALKKAFRQLQAFTHVIFTSRQAVNCLCEALVSLQIGIKTLQSKIILSIGRGTSLQLEENEIPVMYQATKERAEGIVELIQNLPQKERDFFFYPHSALSRSLIPDFLSQEKRAFVSAALYTTIPNTQLSPPDLKHVDEIVFTSPSTVDAFLSIYGKFPPAIKMSSLGPITAKYLFSRI